LQVIRADVLEVELESLDGDFGTRLTFNSFGVVVVMTEGI